MCPCTGASEHSVRMCSRTGAAEHSVCSVCECLGIWRMCYRAYWKREQACEPARIATEHDTCARPCCRHITQHGISFATEHAVSCDNNLILGHLSCRRSSTATEHAGGTATEHRGKASRKSQLFYVDINGGFVQPGSATEQTMRQ